MKLNSSEISPLLKWVGGKARLKSAVVAHFPSKFERYFEPFVGGGAIFFSLEHPRSVLSDINEHLVNFYTVVAKHPIELMDSLQKFEKEFNALPTDSRRSWHESLRGEFNQRPKDDIARASMFLALNKTSFNGLYRENAAGMFNVPFNAMKGTLKLFDRENLLRCSRLLQQAELLNESYESAVGRASNQDLVYFDPPYVPSSPTSDFTAYSRSGFGEKDQRKLIETAVGLVEKGAHVILSNSYTPWVLENYPDSHFKIHGVDVMRGVAANASSRGRIKEALIVSK